MTVDANNPMPGDRPRYLYLGLIASLAVNLLFVGLFATAAWHLHQEQEAPPKPDTPGFMGFVDSLPADHQKAVRDEVTAARSKMKDLRAGLQKQWLEANALLAEEPFDKDKFAAALMALKDSEARFRESIYNMVANTAAMLTPDERKLLQKWRADRRARFLARHNDKNGPDDKDGDKKPLTD